MKSILQSLHSSAPLDRGHIVTEFDVTSFPDDQRRTVAKEYGVGKLNYGRQDDCWIVGIIKQTGEFLVVPNGYQYCTFGRKSEPQQRPAAGHVNNPEIMRLINESTPKAH